MDLQKFETYANKETNTESIVVYVSNVPYVSLYRLMRRAGYKHPQNTIFRLKDHIRIINRMPYINPSTLFRIITAENFAKSKPRKQLVEIVSRYVNRPRSREHVEPNIIEPRKIELIKKENSMENEILNALESLKVSINTDMTAIKNTVNDLKDRVTVIENNSNTVPEPPVTLKFKQPEQTCGVDKRQNMINRIVNYPLNDFSYDPRDVQKIWFFELQRRFNFIKYVLEFENEIYDPDEETDRQYWSRALNMVWDAGEGDLILACVDTWNRAKNAFNDSSVPKYSPYAFIKDDCEHRVSAEACRVARELSEHMLRDFTDKYLVNG